MFYITGRFSAIYCKLINKSYEFGFKSHFIYVYESFPNLCLFLFFQVILNPNYLDMFSMLMTNAKENRTVSIV